MTITRMEMEEWTEEDIIISDLQFPIIIAIIITTIPFLTHFCFVTMARTTIYHIPRVLFYGRNPVQKLLMVHILPLSFSAFSQTHFCTRSPL